MRTAAQDALNEKQLSSLACTLPLFFFYNHKNLLLEIHTSVRVVIMCQRVWSGGGVGSVIFMAEQELDGGQHILQKKEKKKTRQDSFR